MEFLNRLFLKKLPLLSVESKDEIHILNEEELYLIKKEYYSAIYQTALLGFLGVLFYYLPMYYLDFLSQKVAFSIVNQAFNLPLYDIGLCIVLTVLEIYLLTLIHLKLTYNIAVITGYINEGNKNSHLEKIEKIATAKKDKEITKFGLDPFQEINKTLLVFINLLLKLKGFLANKALRYLIQRFAGRYTVKYVMDFAGAPIYMLLNAYTTHVIYKNAKAEIFGVQLIDRFINSLNKKELTEVEKELIYDTLQLIAISKQDFHANHSILTQQIISFYNIPIKKQHLFTDAFYERLAITNENLKNLSQQIIIIGLLLDGKISWREKNKIKQLASKKILQYEVNDITLAAHQFINGKKIDILTF